MSAHWAYRVISGPTEEPLSLVTAKKHAKITIPDEDDQMDAWIRAARIQVEGDTNLKLMPQTLELALDAFPCDGSPLKIQTGPVQSVTSVKYYDSANPSVLQTLAASNYVVDVTSVPARIGLAATGQWPSSLRPFQPGLVTFVAGWTAAGLIPEPLLRAMALWIGWFSENRQPAAFERDAYDALITNHALYVAA